MRAGSTSLFFASTDEPGRQIGSERPFPAPEMGRAGDLDPHPVRLVGSGPRAVAAAPLSQTLERGGILGGFRQGGRKARYKR